MVKPKERRSVKVEALLLDVISGVGTIKLLGLDTYNSLTMKVKFERNKGILGVTNVSTQVIVLYSKGIIAILNIRSLVFFKSNKESHSKG